MRLPRPVVLVSVLLGLAGLTTLPGVAGAAADERVQHCQGREATIVGTPGSDLLGTPGDDVIVTAGARSVDARGGDDLICTVGYSGIELSAGPGDDTVDRRGDEASSGPFGVTAYIDLGPGTDTFYGNLDGEQVLAGDGDRVDGGGSSKDDYDDVRIGGPGQGAAYATVRLPDGSDRTSLPHTISFEAPPVAGFDVSAGTDGYVFLNRLIGPRRHWRIDLEAGTLTRDGRPFGRIGRHGLLNVRVDGRDGPPVRFLGRGTDDDVGYAGTRPLVADLGAGDDGLAFAGLRCADRLRVRASGGPGTDELTFLPHRCDDRVPSIDLAGARVRLGRSTLARVTGFEDARLVTPSLRGTVSGSGNDNRLEITGCGGTILGRGGDDRLYVSPGYRDFFLFDCPARARNVLRGGPGDDVLRGETSVRVTMRGGAGVDRGRGEELDRDVCRTETRRDCRVR